MSSMVLDGGMPRSRASDPVTSVDAGRAADLKGSQAAVMECFTRQALWAQPDLEEELCSRWSPSRIRSAVSELVEKGLLQDSGIRTITRYQRQAIVWMVTAYD